MVEESMWGDVPTSGKGIKLPSEYLVEQANILSKMYAYKLKGVISDNISSSGKVSIDFDICAPSLGSYSYSVLRIIHGLDIYPLTLYGLANKENYKCDNEAQFKDALRSVLSSNEVKKIIENILTLMKS